jgi:hypothetical protein
MKMDEIKEIAKLHDIKVARLKKTDLVRAIQQAEGNAQCFDSGMSHGCGQHNCLWREDCN